MVTSIYLPPPSLTIKKRKARSERMVLAQDRYTHSVRSLASGGKVTTGCSQRRLPLSTPFALFAVFPCSCRRCGRTITTTSLGSTEKMRKFHRPCWTRDGENGSQTPLQLYLHSLILTMIAVFRVFSWQIVIRNAVYFLTFISFAKKLSRWIYERKISVAATTKVPKCQKCLLENAGFPSMATGNTKWWRTYQTT